jgi:hypothetical protein
MLNKKIVFYVVHIPRINQMNVTLMQTDTLL